MLHLFRRSVCDALLLSLNCTVLLEQLLHVVQGARNLLGETLGARRSARFLGRNVEEDQILTGHDVRHAVTVVGDRPEASAGADAVRVLLEIHLGGLAVRGLTSGQPPRFAQHLLQEG